MEINEVIKNMEEAIERTSCVYPKETPEMLEAIRELQSENKKLKDALTPSGATKCVHIGEYEFSQEMYGYDEDGEPNEGLMFCQIPWTSVKDIMKGIVNQSGVKL